MMNLIFKNITFFCCTQNTAAKQNQNKIEKFKNLIIIWHLILNQTLFIKNVLIFQNPQVHADLNKTFSTHIKGSKKKD